MAKRKGNDTMDKLRMGNYYFTIRLSCNLEKQS